jgi:hypothetical protein
VLPQSCTEVKADSTDATSSTPKALANPTLCTKRGEPEVELEGDIVYTNFEPPAHNHIDFIWSWATDPAAHSLALLRRTA